MIRWLSKRVRQSRDRCPLHHARGTAKALAFELMEARLTLSTTTFAASAQLSDASTEGGTISVMDRALGGETVVFYVDVDADLQANFKSQASELSRDIVFSGGFLNLAGTDVLDHTEYQLDSLDELDRFKIIAPPAGVTEHHREGGEIAIAEVMAMPRGVASSNRSESFGDTRTYGLQDTSVTPTRNESTISITRGRDRAFEVAGTELLRSARTDREMMPEGIHSELTTVRAKTNTADPLHMEIERQSVPPKDAPHKTAAKLPVRNRSAEASQNRPLRFTGLAPAAIDAGGEGSLSSDVALSAEDSEPVAVEPKTNAPESEDAIVVSAEHSVGAEAHILTAPRIENRQRATGTGRWTVAAALAAGGLYVKLRTVSDDRRTLQLPRRHSKHAAQAARNRRPFSRF